MFVLGAGFSYAAGFPLAVHLLPRVFDLLRPEDQDQLLTAIRYHYPFPPTAGRDAILSAVGVEDFMSLLDMSEVMNERLPTTFLKPSLIRELRRKLLTAMADLMIISQEKAEDERKVGYVDAFVRRLGVRDTIVTFNWDLLVERRLRYANIQYAYQAPEGSRPLLTLLKLHGSIDWFHGGELNRLDEARQVHRQLFQLPYFRLKDRHAEWRQSAAPFIVPPTFFKTVKGTEDLERVWALAFERLEDADEIHMCGYRLPREDMYARVVLRRAIRANTMRRSREKAPPLIVTVVNPSPDVAEEMKSILHHELIPEHDKFQESRWVMDPSL